MGTAAGLLLLPALRRARADAPDAPPDGPAGVGPVRRQPRGGSRVPSAPDGQTIPDAHEHGPRPPGDHDRPRRDLQPRAARPVATPATRLSARLGDRDGVLRDRHRVGGDRGRHGVDRSAVSRLVPDRRGLDRGLAGSRHGLPARPHPLRLRLRALPLPGGPFHVPDRSARPGRLRVGRHACRCSTSSPPACSPWSSRSRRTSRTGAGPGSRCSRSAVRRSSPS